MIEETSIGSFENQNKSYLHDSFLHPQVNKSLLVINFILALVYFCAIVFLFPISNKIMFGVLVVTEVFHLWQAFTFWFTIWDTSYTPARTKLQPPVDVFITVCGEPVEIVEQTVRAAQNMDYPHFQVYVLNDGFVAKKSNWKEIEAMSEKLGVKCITRTKAGGAKAGNINHALSLTSNPFFAIFDADHVPHNDFLKVMMSYFYNSQVAFAQAPQYYRNYEYNYITRGAWEQQELFFGPICEGKNRMNATFMCGTNMVIRREAILEVGGMCETNIAEDFLTSLFIHKNGWKSVYVPEILAEGLAPEDFLSYSKQQFRWARGSLELLFRFNPIFSGKLTWKQKIQYLSSASYWLSGLIVVLNALLPIYFFFTGQVPFVISTMILATVFLPYIFLTIYTLSLSTNFSFTYRAIAFSISSFPIQLKALWRALFNIKDGFAVTAKKRIQGNFVNLIIPQIIYLFLTIAGVGVAIVREGLSASVISNLSWAVLNCVIFSMFIVAALPEFVNSSEKAEEKSPVVETHI